MDNWMAPRAFAGGNGKLGRQQGKPAAPATGAVTPGVGGESGEEREAAAAVAVATSTPGGGGGAIGMLKRKRTSPPQSPVPGKKRASEESDVPKPSTAGREFVEVVSGGTSSKEVTVDSRVSKLYLRPAPEAAASAVLPPEEALKLGFEDDGNELKKGEPPPSVENVSHGQRVSVKSQRPPETSAQEMPLVAETHCIPSHAGWFQWTKINKLERLGLPEFFVGKNSLKSPELYVEYRNKIIIKYRENPRTMLKVEDVQDVLTGNAGGLVRLFGFLDHWGLINYQATTDFSTLLSSGKSGNVEETSNGALQVIPLKKPALTNLFRFDPTVAPTLKLLSPRLGPSSNLPLATLAESSIQESLAAPSVEYHCNSCQADCSKRRYHCQKQADFDLCPDCYSDGKFGEGMAGSDFLLMDALTETGDANGGGWSDQETLLLLEALELYGDNWTEIAEHVATKSRAQCILHFVRLPIEDPFLEDMEIPSLGIVSQPPSATAIDTNGAAQAEPVKTSNDSQAEPVEKEKSPSGEAKEPSPSKPDQDTSMASQEATKDLPDVMKSTEEKAITQRPEKEADVSAIKSSKSSKGEDPTDVAHFLLAAADSAGSAGPDGLIAFADAGNPVMTQVAFLAAMVGPRVAAAAAQAALKSLAEEDPVAFLSMKNSFVLDLPPKQGVVSVSGSPGRLAGDESAGNHSVALPKGPAVSADSGKAAATDTDNRVADSGKPAATDTDNRVAITGTDEEDKQESPSKATASADKSVDGDSAQNSQKPEAKTSVSPVAAGEEALSMAKVHNAAACALASAAVKAKLLADQEEREIQRLVAGVIENQLKKLEVKLKLFNELEVMLGKESEQAEKARAKVYGERARIVASRLASNMGQMQSSAPSLVQQSKPSVHPSVGAAQPRPAVFTFGPSGVSAPAMAPKTSAGPPLSTSIQANTSSPQAARLPRPTPGTSSTSGVK